MFSFSTKHDFPFIEKLFNWQLQMTRHNNTAHTRRLWAEKAVRVRTHSIINLFHWPPEEWFCQFIFILYYFFLDFLLLCSYVLYFQFLFIVIWNICIRICCWFFSIIIIVAVRVVVFPGYCGFMNKYKNENMSLLELMFCLDFFLTNLNFIYLFVLILFVTYNLTFQFVLTLLSYYYLTLWH